MKKQSKNSAQAKTEPVTNCFPPGGVISLKDKMYIIPYDEYMNMKGKKPSKEFSVMINTPGGDHPNGRIPELQLTPELKRKLKAYEKRLKQKAAGKKYKPIDHDLVFPRYKTITRESLQKDEEALSKLLKSYKHTYEKELSKTRTVTPLKKSK